MIYGDYMNWYFLSHMAKEDKQFEMVNTIYFKHASFYGYFAQYTSYMYHTEVSTTFWHIHSGNKYPLFQLYQILCAS